LPSPVVHSEVSYRLGSLSVSEVPESPTTTDSSLVASPTLSNMEVDSPPTDTRKRRARNPLKVEKRVEIIKFAEENRNMTRAQLADHFGVPRTTVYGILKQKETLLEQPTTDLPQNAYRIIEYRFKILEEILVFWFKDLVSRQIPVKRRMIMAQAQDVHRMLSGLLVEPLPPCLFTSGWLKRFKDRRNIDLKTSYGGAAAADGDVKCELTKKAFSKYEPDRIYACEITNIYLSLAPLKLQRDAEEESATSKPDSSSASIVFCFNASGTDKRDPLILGKF